MAKTIAEELMEQGRRLGELRAARWGLRDVLEIRFGTLPEPLAQQIEALADLERLLQGFRQALRVPRLDEFTL
jgi:hypothetical protein